ncbi:hypothetical protein PG984_003085 [Apiospora sp. TS-2023a]
MSSPPRNTEPPDSFAARISRAVKNGDLADVQRVVAEFQQDPSPSTYRRKALNSAACQAVVGKQISMLEFLLENGVPVTGLETLLIPSAFQYLWDTKILQAMYEHGWEAEHINKDIARHQFAMVNTVLREMAMRSVDLAEWLLDHGLDPNLKGNKGLTMITGDMTPMNAAAYNGRVGRNTAVMDLLLSRGARLSPSVLAVAIGWRGRPTYQLQVLQWLVDHGADVNCRMNSGGSLLKAVIGKRDAVLVQFLLDHGAETDHLGEEMLVDVLEDDSEVMVPGYRGSALDYAFDNQADEIFDIIRKHRTKLQGREGAE